MTEHRAEGEQYTYGQYLESQIAEVIRMYKADGPQHQPGLHDRRGTEGYLSHRPAVFTRHRYPHQKTINSIFISISDHGTCGPVSLQTWQASSCSKNTWPSEIGVEDGEMVVMSKGLHIYEYCWDLAKMVVKR